MSSTQRWALGVVNVLVVGVVVFVARFDSTATATAIFQTLVLGDTLWVLWLYTQATFRLARTAESQVGFMKAHFRDERLQELMKRKPIVFTDRSPDGETRISNLGNALAANVWYLTESGGDPIPLGSLGQGQSRIVPTEVADKHILIRRSSPDARWYSPQVHADLECVDWAGVRS